MFINQDALKKQLDDIKKDAEERDAEHRAEKLKLPYLNLDKIPVSIEALKLVDEEEARLAGLAPVDVRDQKVVIGTFSPSNPGVDKIVSSLKDKKYEPKLAIVSRRGLEIAWASYAYVSEKGKKITGKIDIPKTDLVHFIELFKSFDDVKKELASFDYRKGSVTKLFEMILAGAIANKASDIHIEAGERQAKIRVRVDGLLHELYGELPPKNYESLISRLKLVSGLKINVHSEAQDGRFTISLPTKEIEMRVSVIPSEFGETVVMRVLDPDSINVSLSGLGLRDDDLVLIEKELKKPNGLILNTGPTGSGKTTTLYAFLRHILSSEIKMITVEDPIEYRIDGIEQTQVDTGAGYTFASGLRSMLRQDPDVILVGEIRDAETADIAMQASLTGHLVFSTLHTNDAPGAVPRLVDLGVKTASIGPALSLVIAQRLVRKMCDKCRREKQISNELAQKLEKFLSKLPPKIKKEDYILEKEYEAVGCSYCNNTGYKGRLGLFEFLDINKEAGEAIVSDASWMALKRLAEKQGMVTMQQDGILKAIKGITSFKEVEEATGEIEW